MKPKVKAAVDFIEENLHRDIYVEEIAELVALSRSRLTHLFTIEVGMPPSKYIEKVRMERACQLLGTSFESIKSIGLKVGYNSVSHFDEQFKKAFGVTPLEYRVQHIVPKIAKRRIRKRVADYPNE